MEGLGKNAYLMAIKSLLLWTSKKDIDYVRHRRIKKRCKNRIRG
jgi:hypothetical protein